MKANNIMAILADIKGISKNVQVFREDDIPEGHFVAGINVNGTAYFYLLQGTFDADGAVVKGRVEVPMTANCLTSSAVYFIGSALKGGKAAGSTTSFEDAYAAIADFPTA